jgi:hypothetical protein
MAYKILNTDGTTLLLLADGIIDRATTSISLIGKNANAYGENLNNNFIKILANSASPTSVPPVNPLLGQLWYDTTSKRLKIYDAVFKTISGAIVSGTRPENLSTGDFWFDTDSNQLKILSGNDLLIASPLFSKVVGENGWVLPTTPLTNINYINQDVSLLKNYNTTLGILSSTAFTLTPTESVAYFNTSAKSVVAGLTIIGDIDVTGQLTNKFLSLNVEIDKISPTNSYINIYNDVVIQNAVIISQLTLMFPAKSNTTYNDIAVPIGSEARVFCNYTLPYNGFEIRRFRVVDQAVGGPTWQPYNIYPGTISGYPSSNVVQ